MSSAGQRKASLRHALPLALILVLLFALIAAPIIMRNANADEGLKFLPNLAPVHALFQESPAASEEAALPSQTGGAATKLDSSVDGESPLDNSKTGFQRGEADLEPTGLGGGSFRTVPYQSTD